MASRLIQTRKLPGGYTLYVYDSGHTGVKYTWIDAELSSPEWIAFTARVSVPGDIDLKSREAASHIVRQLLDASARTHKTLTDDQKDFLNSIESLKLRAWADLESDDSAPEPQDELEVFDV